MVVNRSPGETPDEPDDGDWSWRHDGACPVPGLGGGAFPDPLPGSVTWEPPSTFRLRGSWGAGRLPVQTGGNAH